MLSIKMPKQSACIEIINYIITIIARLGKIRLKKIGLYIDRIPPICLHMPRKPNLAISTLYAIIFMKFS